LVSTFLPHTRRRINRVIDSGESRPTGSFRLQEGRLKEVPC
jgi:hypothetical protein